MIKNIILKQWKSSKSKNDSNIIALCKFNPLARILDLGCDEGTWTLRLGRKIGSNQLYGIELVDERIKQAKTKGVNVKKSDLNIRFPFPEGYFDVIHANQVIEHLLDTDNFVTEIYRVLKPGGYCIISTENLSAWDNLFALLLGQQGFSQHISSRWAVGNKFSPHYGKPIELKSWSHKIIFTYFGLQQLFKKYGFKNIEMKAAGHFPLPNIFDYVDPVHSHFITMRAYKAR